MLWLITDKGDPDALALADGLPLGLAPHYSRQTVGSRQFTRNGQNLVFITPDCRACWVTFRPTPGKARRTDGLDCWENAFFRNEGPSKASDLIREAVVLSQSLWRTWPVDGMITFIKPEFTRSEVVGYCYRRAGWARWGAAKDGKPRFRRLKAPPRIDWRLWRWKTGRGGRLRATLEAP